MNDNIPKIKIEDGKILNWDDIDTFLRRNSPSYYYSTTAGIKCDLNECDRLRLIAYNSQESLIEQTNNLIRYANRFGSLQLNVVDEDKQ